MNPLRTGINIGFLTSAEVLKFVEVQDDVLIMCKALWECQDAILGPSVESKSTLGKELMG